MAQTMQEFLLLAEPGIIKVWMEEETPVETQYTKVFNVGTQTNLYEDEFKMAGFGSLYEVPEGDEVQFDKAIPPVRKRYEVSKFGLGYKATDKLWKFDRYGEVRRLESALRRADEDHTETYAFSLLNNATTTTHTGFDGLALVSTAHTRLDGGPVWANRPTTLTALSVASLQDAIVAFKKLKDDRGRPYRSNPKTLLIPIDLEMVAIEILGSSMRPDTNNNVTNAISRYGIDWMSSHYITSSTFAALLGDKHDMNIRWAQRPQQKTDTVETSGTIRRWTTKWISRGFGEARGTYMINS